MLREIMNHQVDEREIREALIRKSICIPFDVDNKEEKLEDIRAVKAFYQQNINKYSEWSFLPWKRYIASEFWFNDAGFQFKWRNGEMIIINECISWRRVLKWINLLRK